VTLVQLKNSRQRLMKIASEHQDTIACSSLSALDKDTTLRVRLEAKVKFPFTMCTAQLIDLRCRLFADQSASVYVSSNQKVSAPCRVFPEPNSEV
jgi:hypothetical protein